MQRHACIAMHALCMYLQILSVRVMWEFWFNSRLQPPYTLMQSFLAIFVPDLAYSYARPPCLSK